MNMNQRGRSLGLFFIVISLAATTFYLIVKAPLALYIGWGFMVLAVAVLLTILQVPSINMAFMISFMLAVGSFGAYGGFHDLPAAWFFLIAAVCSVPIVLVARRYLRSIVLQGQQISELPQDLQSRWGRLFMMFIRGLSLGFTVAILVMTVYVGWRTWPKVSGNILILATILLIFLIVGSMRLKQTNEKPKRWLSVDGVFAFAHLLGDLLLPVLLVLLLLNFVAK